MMTMMMVEIKKVVHDLALKGFDFALEVFDFALEVLFHA